jgi:prepilin-type N-terminal cleavage/methylation domain-containing protein
LNRADHTGKAGFTLLEVLLALSIASAAFAIILATFTTTVDAWRRGQDMLEDLHHGDFVMEQLVSAVRSAAYFDGAGGKYGFRLYDNGEGLYQGDMFSWVTSGTAFMPVDSELANGLHRIVFSVEPNDDGDWAAAIRAYPHLAEYEDDEIEPWFVSTMVKGVNCRVYIVEEDEEASEGEWEDMWEDTNSLPGIVELTLYMEPLEEYGDPVTIQRMVRIPVAPEVSGGVVIGGGQQQDRGEGGNQGSGNEAGREQGDRTAEDDGNRTRIQR